MNHSPLDQVIELLGEMPGIGKKTAQRLAFFILNRESDYALQLSRSLQALKETLRWCSSCYNISDLELCEICRQPERNPQVICVVEDAVNVANVERSGGFRGYYHVLQGVLSPVNGVGPDELKINELLARIDAGDVLEVILATNPTVEGEATAMYIAGLLESRGCDVTRIAVGVPIGGSLDYCDEITMAKALENRRKL